MVAFPKPSLARSHAVVAVSQSFGSGGAARRHLPKQWDTFSRNRELQALPSLRPSVRPAHPAHFSICDVEEETLSLCVPFPFPRV